MRNTAAQGCAGRFIVITAATVIVIAALLWYANVRLLPAYLVAVNAAACLQYGFDKRQARRRGLRVPECVLHLTALAGGSIGAIIGSRIFRHKTAKLSFRVVMAAIIIIQAAAVVFWCIRAR